MQRTSLLNLIALLTLLLPATVSASVWLTKPAKATDPDKPIARSTTIQVGDYPNGQILQPGNIDGVEASAYLVDPDGEVRPARLEQGRIHFDTPLKGHHWAVYAERQVRGDTLYVTLAKFRFYNSKGDVGDYVLKEIRGTLNSKFDRPPLAELSFEIVALKPEKQHHINCCFFSGDIARFRVFHQQSPLADASVHLVSANGWRSDIRADTDGLVRFEIPRLTYVDTTKERMAKHHLLVTAEHTVDAQGHHGNKPYRRIHYSITRPIMFHPSPLEWAAKLPAFLIVFGVTLVLGFGVYLHRRKART